LALITWPRPAGTICSSAAIVPLIVPTALIESIIERVASSCSQASPVRRTPALLTQRSRLPCSATIAAARARQAASSRTSSAALSFRPSISAAVRAAASPSTSVAQTA
jgi:hypothetical protein